MSSKSSRFWPAALVVVMGLMACVAALRIGAQDEPPRPRATDKRAAELSEEEFEAVLSIVAERQPVMAERLKGLRESDPEQYRQALRRLLDHERLRPLVTMRRNDPQGFELHLAALRAKSHAGRLRRQLHEGPRDPESLRAELRQAAEQVVDAEFKTREHELAQLRKRLDRLEQDLTDRRANREKLVAQYYERLAQPPKKDAERPIISP